MKICDIEVRVAARAPEAQSKEARPGWIALPLRSCNCTAEIPLAADYFRGVSELEELEVELDGVLLVSELELVLPVVPVAEPLVEPAAEPLAEPLALMSLVLEDDEGVVLEGVAVLERSASISELLRVDLLQPAKPKAKAARAAAPVSFNFCVFIFLPQGF